MRDRQVLIPFKLLRFLLSEFCISLQKKKYMRAFGLLDIVLFTAFVAETVLQRLLGILDQRCPVKFLH